MGGRILSRFGSLSMFSTCSPGAFGDPRGPNTWYKKKTHNPMASKPSTRMGRATAMLLLFESCAVDIFFNPLYP